MTIEIPNRERMISSLLINQEYTRYKPTTSRSSLQKTIDKVSKDRNRKFTLTEDTRLKIFIVTRIK